MRVFGKIILCFLCVLFSIFGIIIFSFSVSGSPLPLLSLIGLKIDSQIVNTVLGFVVGILLLAGSIIEFVKVVREKPAKNDAGEEDPEYEAEGESGEKALPGEADSKANAGPASVEEIFERYAKSISHKRVYYRGRIPPKKLQNALAVFEKKNKGNLPLKVNPDNAMWMMDDSVLGSGKSCAVFTDEGVYFTNRAGGLEHMPYASMYIVGSDETELKFYSNFKDSISYIFFTGDAEVDAEAVGKIAQMLRAVKELRGKS